MEEVKMASSTNNSENEIESVSFENIVQELDNASPIDILKFALDIYLLGLEDSYYLIDEKLKVEKQEVVSTLISEKPEESSIPVVEVALAPKESKKPQSPLSKVVLEEVLADEVKEDQKEFEPPKEEIIKDSKVSEEPKDSVVLESAPAPLKEKEKEEPNISADDWMDLMMGKKPEAAQEASIPTKESGKTEEVEGPHLKKEIDFTEHHSVPERQAPRKKEKKESVREGLKKRECFSATKLKYRKSFSSKAKIPARVCSFCRPKSRSNVCVSCEEDNARSMARLCEKCGKDKKTANNCVICGRPNSRGIAKLCDRCAPSYRRYCYKCGAKL